MKLRLALTAILIVAAIVAALARAEAAPDDASRPVCLRVWSYTTHRYVQMCPCPSGWGSIATCQIYRPVTRYSR